jgi:cytidylate kinase
VVFPDAPVKLFLGASPEARARRRHKQLMEHGISASLSGLAQEIAERDARDARRKAAPLRPAADAILLDTTDLTIAEVRARTRAIVDERLHLQLTGSGLATDPGNDSPTGGPACQ